MHSPSTALIAVACVGWLLMALGWSYAIKHRREARSWESKANTWFHRAVMLGWDDYQNYPITAAQAEKIMADLFPRPMGATSWKPSPTTPTTERAWRERRAVTGPDHTRRYSFGGDSESEIAEAVCAMWLTNPPEGEQP